MELKSPGERCYVTISISVVTACHACLENCGGHIESIVISFSLKMCLITFLNNRFAIYKRMVQFLLRKLFIEKRGRNFA